MTDRVFILGTSGLAREMVDLARLHFGSQSRCELVSFEEEDRIVHGATALLGMGDPLTRSRVMTRLSSKLHFPAIRHPFAELSESSTIGQGTILTSGSVVTCDVALGDGVLLNLNATVGHDATVGSFTCVNPGAHISGSVTIGERCLIGAGAIILEGINVGSDARIGAGAVVTRDVAPGTTVVGVPAKLLSRVVSSET